MSRDPRYDILFEPVKIGPVTARNRFFQVPHCNGMGHQHPQAHAAMRGMKAEGGWAVVATEECEIHPSGDVSPYVEARIWDDHDIPYLSMMTEAVHRHGSLAAVELVHNGPSASNLYSREVPLGPSHQPTNYYPFQVRAMDREDIRNYRRWHREAALRAKRAGFDIVYVYAGHDLSLPMHFLQRRRNQRIDEYGGSLENRVRLFRELIEEAKEAVGDTCGVVVRFAVDEMMGEDGISSEGEAKDIVAMLAELPDLWDVNLSNWKYDSQTSRFAEEGYQEPFTAFVKKLTSKPVVGVGRYTSPDRMVSLIKKGVLDMIGAARPSIADPYLPKKIEEGRLEDIRECIGCNICITGDMTITPMRCTQNPTQGEEWRKGWHPEIMPAKASNDRILIIGGGPAGLEAARALGQRGHEVALAEASTELGGRVNLESRLPGLSAWGRVRDYRLGQIAKMSNVETYPGSPMGVTDILDQGFERVVLATGATWRKDGVGRSHAFPIPGLDTAKVFSPDDIMAGRLPDKGPILVYDDDLFYLAGVLAERLAKAGLEVIYVTTADTASSWTSNTLEVYFVNKRLHALGVRVICQHDLVAVRNGVAEIAPAYGEAVQHIPVGAIVPVTARLPNDALYQELMAAPEKLKDAGIKSVTRIGDCLAPGLIAYAVYAGHRYARELDAPDLGEVKFRRALPLVTTP
ncbi:dimethylamine/trimethylamine dehydrogenase [Dongia mobilis]|uniref:Dimethylamine/trimethylamine dehydrogenase n=1 Tax=Dongia mobilis TaxID=578943 RepID=A0A4R6WWZ9_9PROT|nr:FAD-dependent oxidoreductase [Dongia mobilis]TDQ84217.1 dimethylamine/trimethylamine dehydrogenase [Dongia mobilis]